MLQPSPALTPALSFALVSLHLGSAAPGWIRGLTPRPSCCPMAPTLLSPHPLILSWICFPLHILNSDSSEVCRCNTSLLRHASTPVAYVSAEFQPDLDRIPVLLVFSKNNPTKAEEIQPVWNQCETRIRSPALTMPPHLVVPRQSSPSPPVHLQRLSTAPCAAPALGTASRLQTLPWGFCTEQSGCLWCWVKISNADALSVLQSIDFDYRMLFNVHPSQPEQKISVNFQQGPPRKVKVYLSVLARP